MHRFELGLLTLLAVAVAAPAQDRGPARTFGWHSDYSAARAEAKRTGKPMFLVFRCEP